jgi:hypothetical protein
MQQEIAIKIPHTTRPGWADSTLYPLLNQSGQFKNKLAAELVKVALSEQGISCAVDEFNNVLFGQGNQSEIKIAFAKIQGIKREFWFNQIRPNLNNWSHIHFVCVHPNKIDIYQFTKENCLQLCEEAQGLSHTGQNDLKAVKVYQKSNNSMSGNYWKLNSFSDLQMRINPNRITFW